MKAKYETYEEAYYKRADADLRAIVLLKYGWTKAEIWNGYDEFDRPLYHVKVTRRIPIEKEV